ncbi:MAG: hypothetical protein IPK83_06335 [Planctomycetes bacterium]|nr:hypothetical protein [Planctomycetota bacterium]
MIRPFKAITLCAILAGALPAQAEIVYRINCGGPDYVDPAGNMWTSDNGSGFFNVGKTPPSPVSPTIDIAGTDLDPLYRSERYDTADLPNMIYTFPAAPGYYLVKLHFAETYWTKPNRRKFDVAIEGTTVLVNYDIVDGIGPFTADVRQFVTEVVDGDLQIEFMNAIPRVDNPKISAIEIERISTAPIITRVSRREMRISQGSVCNTPENRVTFTADDPDTDDSGLRWTIKKNPKYGSVSFVAGLSDGPDVTVCYIPAANQSEDDSFTLRVDDLDPNGGIADSTMLVSIVDLAPPVIECPANVTIHAGDSIKPADTGRPAVTDAIDASPLVTFADVTESRDCPESSRITRTWTSTDKAGNVASCVQTIKIFDADVDGDGTVDCEDSCPEDTLKTESGLCGCGMDDADRNNDGQPDCTPTQGVLTDDDTGEQAVPGAEECCGGGTPILTPFLLLAFPRRRRRTRM